MTVRRNVLLAILVLLLPADALAQAADRYSAAIAHGRSVLEELVEGRRLPGVAVAVGVGDEIVWSEGFGFADLEQRVAVSRNTRFGLGSISKTFTMAGALKLVQAGLLDIDTPIETYLADFPHRGRGITVRRLAVHQSGLADAFAAAHARTTRHFPTIESAYQEIRREPLTYEPGSKHEYATGLFTIIGRVMEVVSRRSYLEVMQTNVFTPAGMRGVVPNDRTREIAHRTQFYVQNDAGAFERAPFFDPSFKLPGAGFLATADDVARFGMALLNDRFIGEALRAEMFRPVPLNDGTPTEFALGLRYTKQDGRTLLHLPGGGFGISSWLYIYPAERVVIALLSNVPTGPVGGRTHREIARAFLNAAANAN